MKEAEFMEFMEFLEKVAALPQRKPEAPILIKTVLLPATATAAASTSDTDEASGPNQDGMSIRKRLAAVRPQSFPHQRNTRSNANALRISTRAIAAAAAARGNGGHD